MTLQRVPGVPGARPCAVPSFLDTQLTSVKVHPLDAERKRLQHDVVVNVEVAGLLVPDCEKGKGDATLM